MGPETQLTYAKLLTMAGQELGLSGWVTIGQDRIDKFAECTGDHQWIHVDPVRARRESPFRKPIAHGQLILSMVSGLGLEIATLPENTQGVINLGIDEVRFISPVVVDSRIRLRSKLLDVELVGSGQYLARILNTIEVEGKEQPSLTCITISKFYERRVRKPA